MFTMCYYKREPKKKKKETEWAVDSRLAVLEDVLKIQA